MNAWRKDLGVVVCLGYGISHDDKLLICMLEKAAEGAREETEPLHVIIVDFKEAGPTVGALLINRLFTHLSRYALTWLSESVSH